MRHRIWCAALLFAGLLALEVPAQFPNLMYFRFDEGTGAGGTTLNEASPGVGNVLAPVFGHSLDAGIGQFGGGLQAAPTSSTANFVDSGWPTAFGTGSWTISFWMDVSTVPTSTLSYMFGDSAAGGFRSFTNGVAGVGNIMIRGPMTDTILPGAAVGGPHVVTWVYDATVPEVRGYLDGVLGVTVAQAPLNITGTAFRVGAYTSSAFAVGSRLDEFRVYDYALTPTQIATSWNTPLFDQNVLSVTTSGPGVGDLSLSLTNTSPTATEGWLLLSGSVAQPVGSGAFFGVNPDATTFEFLVTSPLADGNPFHFPVPSSFNLFPNTPFNLPAGSTAALAGLTFDFGIVLVQPGLAYDSKSNVVRFTF